ncbi:MAG TPA: hypothetical protein HPP90_02910 [Deltaproteobacteria bacterium]|nr:hypothetical protein [Deltaproteobacteria bacterium]
MEQNLAKQPAQIYSAKSQLPQTFWRLRNHEVEKGIYLAPTTRVCLRGKSPARNIPDSANKKASVFGGPIFLDPEKTILFNQSSGYSKYEVFSIHEKASQILLSPLLMVYDPFRQE